MTDAFVYDHVRTPRGKGRLIKPTAITGQIPDDFLFVDTLPRTATREVMKVQLRQQFRDFVSSGW